MSSDNTLFKTKIGLFIYRTVLAGFFLALAIVLPFLTGQIPQIGAALAPMHIPVLLCGFFCGPAYGCAVGAVAPLLRFLICGMPPLFPSGVGMCFELAVYGLVSGLLYMLLPKKKVIGIYISLIGAMIAGRIVWGFVRAFIGGITGTEFSMKAFISGAVLSAVPGIIVQIVLIPIIVMALRNYTTAGYTCKKQTKEK